jgi:hypothetical protein
MKTNALKRVSGNGRSTRLTERRSAWLFDREGEHSMKLRALSALACVPALTACAYATPYAMHFEAPVDGKGSAAACAAAFAAPGRSDLVMTCIEQRGWEWEVRGQRIRQQAGYVGQAAIPAAVLGVGLTAAGDTSDAAPLLAYASGATLAHTSAYARPDQAKIYELATETYDCLRIAASAWRGGGRGDVDDAFVDLDRASAAADALLAGKGLAADDATRVALREQLAMAELALRMLDADVGLMLLRRSNEVDTDARQAISERIPDPQIVAASASRTSARPAAVQTVSPPQAFAADKTLSDAFAAVNAATLVLNDKMAAYGSITRDITVDCAFNPASIDPLQAPSTLTLNGTVGGLVIQGGLPPYGFDPPPSGLTVSMSPLASDAVHVQIIAADGAGAGPWSLRFFDGRNVATTVVVSKGSGAGR